MKRWIEEIGAKIDAIFGSHWMRYVRITGDVFWNLVLLLIISLAALVFFVGGVGAGYFASLVKDEPLRSKEEMRAQIFSYEETSEIYFANNIYIGKLRTDLDRRETSLNSISPLVIDAVLATEDEYFREHAGIVPKAVLRGLLQDVSNSSTQTGGSTLTQQLIKNQILTNEVSYERKAKEILLALRLEKFMEKEEILEAYLNIIPYGRNAEGRNIAGIETAAEGIFGVEAKDLTLPQAAYIAGIPQAPFKYTPFTNKGTLKTPEAIQAGVDRMKTVLYRMHEVGYITKAQYDEAMNYDITQDFRQPHLRPEDTYPWLTAEIEIRSRDILAKMLAEKDGIDPSRLDNEANLKSKYDILADRDLRSNGYRIYSTIDKTMYDTMQEAAKNFEYYGHTYTENVIDEETGEEVTNEQPVQVGSIIIENKTGRILSFVAGRDYNLEQSNHASRTTRQNGSTMKPILVYAPAIEYGKIGAGSPVVDVKFKVEEPGQKPWEPSNYMENDERGIISAREALADSQNLTALRLYREIMDKKPITFLEKMKFESLQPADYSTRSIGIGALTKGATVEETTNAYATFANGGKFVDAYMIEKIVDLDGNIIYEHEVEEVEVYSPETSYIITDMMRDVLGYGTGTRANATLKFKSDFAAKTGTTQNYYDVWFVGYNPSISLGAWLGYDQQRSLYAFNNRYYQPSTRINLLWATLMNAAYDANPELVGTTEKFVQPEGVVTASFCSISGLAPSDACSKAGLIRSDLFNKNIMLPTQPDDSFASSSTVVVNGQAYQALPSTPTEFVTMSGFGLNKTFVDRMLGAYGGDPSRLILRGASASIVAGAEFVADNVAPAAVSVSATERTLTWTASESNDVVGYRIYDATSTPRKLVVSQKAAEQFSFTGQEGSSYYVVAVDITGLESNPSNIIEFKAATPPPAEEPEENNEPPATEEPTPEEEEEEEPSDSE